MKEYPWTGSRLATLDQIVNGDDIIMIEGVDVCKRPIVVCAEQEYKIEDRVAAVFKESHPNIYEIAWALGLLPKGSYEVYNIECMTECECCGAWCDTGYDPRYRDGYEIGEEREVWCTACYEEKIDELKDEYISNNEICLPYIPVDYRIERRGFTQVSHVDCVSHVEPYTSDKLTRILYDINVEIGPYDYILVAEGNGVDVYLKPLGMLGEFLMEHIDDIPLRNTIFGFIEDRISETGLNYA